jgi:hypothetical protein
VRADYNGTREELDARKKTGKGIFEELFGGFVKPWRAELTAAYTPKRSQA